MDLERKSSDIVYCRMYIESINGKEKKCQKVIIK